MRKVGTLIDNLRKGADVSHRHENPYLLESLKFNNYLLTQDELDTQYSSLFPDMQKPLIIEIGCYLGKTLLELAQANKDQNFIGLDITYKRVVKTARKLHLANIENARVAMCDAKFFLQKIVAPNSLRGICLFFPDPWPKERHAKNRLITEEFITTLLLSLTPEGFLWFKTDQEHMFLEVQRILHAHTRTAPVTQPSCLHGGPFETVFQKLFTMKNEPFYQGIFIKK